MDSITCVLHLFLKMHKVVLLDDFFLFVIFNNVTQQTNWFSDVILGFMFHFSLTKLIFWFNFEALICLLICK